ncbi:acyl carrier protein [Glycomyces paridis]|uniref:Acyl carrier protein n=1 Tax=Glycomyces paridis TaxID=2126555 RepID=A0A4S8PL50_9ACTN|nr:acyl carrier protein [Glycomyces paridis]
MVAKALAETLGHDLPDIGDDTRLFEDLSLDSTSILGLMVNLEDALEIEIDPDSISEEHFATFGSLTGFLLEAAGAEPAAG